MSVRDGAGNRKCQEWSSCGELTECLRELSDVAKRVGFSRTRAGAGR